MPLPDWVYIALQSLASLFDTRTDALLGVAAGIAAIAYAMRPRRIYFVRHGETEANVKRIRQGTEGGLSENGRAQAAAAGEYLSRFPIRAIIASPLARAQETAAIINARLKVPLAYSPLLVERRNPSEVIGKSESDLPIARIMDSIDRSYHADDYRYSDEESFTDLRERAKRCLDLLAQQGAHDLCVVTHSIYLKMVIAYLLYRDAFHAGDYIKLSFFNASDNGGITICRYNPWRAWSHTRGWSIIEYNVTPYAGGRGGISDAPPRIPPIVS